MNLILFQRLKKKLSHPVATRIILATLLFLHVVLLMRSASLNSPTLNEPAHLIAGISHLEFGRFELYRVNPPLVRMVAAIPSIVMGYEQDWSAFYEDVGARPVFELGRDFIRQNGKHDFRHIVYGRWCVIPFSIIGALSCYMWSRDLFGKHAGLIAAGLWCFEPNILAHSSLITPDAHATALGVAACYTFYLWLKNPTWSQTIFTGFVLGLAELSKSTLILLYPIWPLVWIAYRIPDRHSMSVRDYLVEATMLMVRMAIGLYVLNLGYGFEEPLVPLKDFQFSSELLTGVSHDGGFKLTDYSQGKRIDLRNRFSGSWLGNFPVPFPKNYIIGIDLQQRDFEDFGRPSYLRGQWQENGWWYYYMYALAVKVPIGLWAMAVVTIVFGAVQGKFACSWTDTMVFFIPAVVVFAIVSSKTGFSHHMRYVLPCFPFAFIWISSCICYGRTTNKPIAMKLSNCLTAFNLSMLLWMIFSSLLVFPHSLSYFNELVGGPKNGPKHLLHSNIDWGQDFLFLKRWIEQNSDVVSDRPFYIAYYGPLDPSQHGIENAINLESDKRIFQISDTVPSRGIYAISVNLLYKPSDAITDWPSNKNDPLGKAVAYFRHEEPIGYAGYSILIFEKQ